MITEEDITQVGEQEKKLAQSYLEGILDFVKWTSAIAIAAILWVGSGMTSTIGLPQKMIIVSLVSLVGSLAVAIFAVNRVLTAWATEWDVAREEYTLLLLKKWKALNPSGVTSQKEMDQIQRVVDGINASRRFSQPTGFRTQLNLHIGFLLVGLILYLVAKVMGSL